MKYFILAGEASGDMHGAALARALFQYDPEATIHGWGGDEMIAAGVGVLKHIRELAFMGFVEVIRHLPQIWRNFRDAKRQLSEFRPDRLVLVDYPGFNLRMARWANRKGIAVYYYISPQLWAWKENRVRIVKDHITRMYVIIPFEEVFYARHKIRVKYVGHPLAWRISEYRKTAVTRPGAKRLVLLPGSRKREILHMLPVMLKAARSLTDFEIHIAAAPAIPGALYYDLIRSSGIRGVTITFGNTYGLLQRATAAFCTSGTATLETALFDVPQVVCYKGDTLSYLIARRLIRVPYIAMVNLICGKTVVPELIQKDFTAPRLLRALDEILTPENLNTLRHDYAVLKDRLTSGNPADAVAQDLCQNLASVNG